MKANYFLGMEGGRFSKILCLLVFFEISGYEIFPQKHGWGEIKEADFIQTYPNIDSGAGAIILFDYGSTDLDDFQGSLRRIYFRHVRILVIDQKGRSFANIKLPYYPALGEQIVEIKANSFLCDGSGQIHSKNLTRSMIYEDRKSHYLSEKIFTIPGIEAGSVFEYSYKLISPDIFSIHPWTFQQSLPVLHSEFRADVKGLVSFSVIKRNISEKKGQHFFTDSIRSIAPFLLSKSGSREIPFEVRYITWIMKNIERLSYEGYSFAPEAKSPRIRFQLTSSGTFKNNETPALEKWDDLAKWLTGYQKFGLQIKADRMYKLRIKEFIEKGLKGDSLIKALMEYTQSNLKWNRQYSMWVNQDISRLDNLHPVNSAEINLYLLNLIREAGCIAYPVLISTRSNGEIQTETPEIEQFNHVLCWVQSGNRKYLLDATGPGRKWDFLDLEDYNGSGLILKDQEVEWMKLPEIPLSESSILISMQFKTEGKMKGYLVIKETGFKAIQRFNDIQEIGDSAYVKKIASSIFLDLKIDSFYLQQETTNIDKLKLAVSFYSDEWLNQFDNKDIIYFDALMLAGISENPFISPFRSLPVEFAYPIEETSIVVIEIPEGYYIEEMPSEDDYKLETGGMSYTFHVANTEEVAQVRSMLKINKTSFDVDEYIDLRELFSIIVMKSGERIVARFEGL